MASRYQKVTDVEKALKYYEAGLLYCLWLAIDFTDRKYIPYHSINWNWMHKVDAIKRSAMAGDVYILIEEDEEQPIG